MSSTDTARAELQTMLDGLQASIDRDTALEQAIPGETWEIDPMDSCQIVSPQFPYWIAETQEIPEFPGSGTGNALAICALRNAARSRIAEDQARLDGLKAKLLTDEQAEEYSASIGVVQVERKALHDFAVAELRAWWRLRQQEEAARC